MSSILKIDFYNGGITVQNMHEGVIIKPDLDYWIKSRASSNKSHPKLTLYLNCDKLLQFATQIRQVVTLVR